jgi:hypothetical protein
VIRAQKQAKLVNRYVFLKKLLNLHLILAQGATAGKYSGAQEGLSNTDTKHSTDISENPDKSKKAEGTPETAKTKGPVDPNRPAA